MDQYRLSEKIKTKNHDFHKEIQSIKKKENNRRSEKSQTSLALSLTISTGVMDDVVFGGVTGDGIFLSAAAIAIDVVAVAAVVVIGSFVRQFILREIVQAHALPHRIHHDSKTEKHDLADAGISTAGDGGVCGSERAGHPKSDDEDFQRTVQVERKTQKRGFCACFRVKKRERGIYIGRGRERER